MTADPQRRRRASRVGLTALGVSIVVVAALTVIAGFTLRSSEEGTEVVPDDRPEQRFPSTPAAILGVVDGDRLSSVAVVVLDPSGVGGSIVTVPVNVDTSSGFGSERTPLARRSFSTSDPDPLGEELGLLLGIEPTFVEVADAARLDQLLALEGPITVSFDRDVVDAVEGDSVTLVGAGERLLEPDQVVAVLTSVPPDGPAIEAHPIDVATWAGLAASWSLTNSPLDIERDEAGVPAEPATIDEVFARLRAGSVEARDLALDRSAPLVLDNPTEADFVSLDTRDSILVFASIAPELVLTPNPTLTFSIVAPFSRSQLATVGEGVTSERLIRDLVGQLVFLEANVVFVDLTPAEGGAPTETVVVVDEEGFLDTASVPTLIGPSTTRIAARDTDGSDVTLLLGTDFLDHRAALIAEREAERDADDGAADFDVSSDSDSEGGADAETDDAVDGDAEGDGADTVDGDG